MHINLFISVFDSHTQFYCGYVLIVLPSGNDDSTFLYPARIFHEFIACQMRGAQGAAVQEVMQTLDNKADGVIKARPKGELFCVNS